MRREEVCSIVAYLIAIIIPVVVIFAVSGDYVVSFMNGRLFTLLTVLLAFVFNVIMLEVLHAIGGKLGGYRVTYINIFYFGFEKIQGKWKFHFNEYDGFTGETRLVPNKENTNLKPYIWLPLVGYILEMALGFTLISVCKNGTSQAIPEWLAYGSLLFILIASAIAFYNIIPLKLDTTTDGYRLVLISNKTNKEAYDELMRVEDSLRNGLDVNDIKTFVEINNFTSEVNLYSVYNDLFKKNYEPALKLIERMLEQKEKINEATYNRLLAQKIYILIMQDLTKAKEFYYSSVKDETRRFIANDRSAESLRAYVLIAGLLDSSRSEVELLKKKVDRILNESLATRAKLEKELYKEALQKVYEVHPDWEKESTAN